MDRSSECRYTKPLVYSKTESNSLILEQNYKKNVGSYEEGELDSYVVVLLISCLEVGVSVHI